MGEQWWYASPIDCAAANGHYDLVVELLHIDANLLIKPTSLRRIRHLETVWDDGDQDQARVVARSLMLECEAKNGRPNSLVRAGYNGWLLYTAASAGDVGFVRDLVAKYPALVFGEGEYGVTDIHARRRAQRRTRLRGRRGGRESTRERRRSRRRKRKEKHRRE